MRIMIVTDAWRPQVNGVVRTLTETTRELSELGHTVEMITPLDFRTFPCPTYPDIRLSWRPYARVAATLKAFAPDAIHIATEGPLGLAARRWCMANQLRFTTAYHTRFPEYIHARVRLPLSASYAFMRWFHGPSAAVMAPTPSIKSALEGWGFNNVVVWSRGVNTDLFCPGERDRLDDSVPPRFVYIGRVAVEKNIEAFLQLDLPGSKWVVGDGPQMELLKRRYPNVWFAGVYPQAELARHGFKHSAATVDSMEAQLILVLSGAYIGYLPEHYAEPWVEKGDLRVLLPATFGYQAPFSMIVRRGRSREPLIQTFRDLLKTQLHKP